MFYPAQTSLIPVQVALARFLESGGSIFNNYPYWYLGTTPFNFLTGPVVPTILVGLHKILPQLSLFDISLALVAISFFLQSVGWGLFSWQLSGRKKNGFIVSLLILLLPWHWVSSLALSELSAVVVVGLTPWILIAGIKIQNLFLTSSLFALLLLTNSVAAIPAIIGLILLGIITIKKWEEGLKRAGIIIIFGWVFTLWWHNLGYWLTLWGAPSLGGRSALNAFAWLIDILRGFVPFFLAGFVVLWGSRVKTAYQKFILCWFGIFALLTVARFVSDPDFWLDWTAWMTEVETGIALLVAKQILNIKSYTSNLFYKVSLVTFCLLLAGGWFFAFKERDFWLPRKDIQSSVEAKIAVYLAKNVKPKEIALLSGTTAFWFNSIADVTQVRGGVDQTSVDKKWRAAVWEIRQGESAEGTKKALEQLSVSYVVVHTKKSQEFYHDFVHPEKFTLISSLEKIYEDEGDIIYYCKFCRHPIP